MTDMQKRIIKILKRKSDGFSGFPPQLLNLLQDAFPNKTPNELLDETHLALIGLYQLKRISVGIPALRWIYWEVDDEKMRKGVIKNFKNLVEWNETEKNWQWRKENGAHITVVLTFIKRWERLLIHSLKIP